MKCFVQPSACHPLTGANPGRRHGSLPREFFAVTA